MWDSRSCTSTCSIHNAGSNMRYSILFAQPGPCYRYSNTTINCHSPRVVLVRPGFHPTRTAMASEQARILDKVKNMVMISAGFCFPSASWFPAIMIGTQIQSILLTSKGPGIHNVGFKILYFSMRYLIFGTQYSLPNQDHV